MSEPANISTSSQVSYKLNSVPSRIRYSGIHKTISQHFHKSEQDGKVIAYLRGRKLEGLKLRPKKLSGLILLKQFDDITTLGKIDESIWFEREGHKVEVTDKIKELQDLTELIHK